MLELQRKENQKVDLNHRFFLEDEEFTSNFNKYPPLTPQSALRTSMTTEQRSLLTRAMKQRSNELREYVRLMDCQNEMFTTPIEYNNKDVTWGTISEFLLGDKQEEDGPYTKFLDVIDCVEMMRKNR